MPSGANRHMLIRGDTADLAGDRALVLAVLSARGRAAGGGGAVACHIRDARGRAGSVRDVAPASGAVRHLSAQAGRLL